MAENEAVEETTYRFEELDDTTVKVTAPNLNGSVPFSVTLVNVTWGMLEEMLAVQASSQDDPGAIFKFLNEYVEGGTKSIPLKRTMQFFQAISEYMQAVMQTQKN
jgi:hypothetical protein